MSLLEPLEYKSLVGEGYFSVVKKYKDKDSGKFIAVKQLKTNLYDVNDYRYRFSREIKLLKDLKGHENIISLIGSENIQTKKEYYYLMPYYSMNLYSFIKRNNTNINLEERLTIFDKILDAIQYSHGKNIIHRDISPTNVLVERNDNFIVKVSDFGLGKNEESLSHYTHSSVSNYGQILYVSPEQRDKLKDSTVRSDIYSLGKLLYFILTGRDPLSFRTTEFSSLIDKSIRDNPDQRYQNLSEFSEHYRSIKELLLTDEIPSEYVILKDYIHQGNTSDWYKFHEIASRGTTVDHVFYDFIDPVIRFLSKGNNLKEYYEAVGSSMFEFVSRFIENMRVCFSTTGWPFAALDGFGSFLYDIFILVDENDIKLLCLEGIWEIAYGADQWDVQDIMDDIFRNNLIYGNLEIQFAQKIKELNIDVDISRFRNMNIPQKIKLAIINLSDDKTE